MTMSDGRPHMSVTGMLTELAKAGAGGISTGDLARRFAFRQSYGGDVQRALAEANTILETQARMGNVRKSAEMEPSAYYNNTPSRRWFITAAGHDYLAEGGRMEIARRARKERERARSEKLARREVAREVTRQLLSAVPGNDRQARNRVIAQVYAEGALTLEDLGRLTGLTRERVRQVIRVARQSPAECMGTAEHGPHQFNGGMHCPGLPEER